MGLGEEEKAYGDGAKKTFSNDVLKIEICGPDQEHYSVIDVPVSNLLELSIPVRVSS